MLFYLSLLVTMRAYPLLVLNHYFLCFNRKRIIFSAIIVTGGRFSRSSVELLFEDGSQVCNLPDLSDVRYGHTQSGLVACGGEGGFDSERKTCVTFDKGEWRKSHQLLQDRSSHFSWLSTNHGIYLMGGGFMFNDQNTELLTDDGASQNSFKLKYSTK